MRTLKPADVFKHFPNASLWLEIKRVPKHALFMVPEKPPDYFRWLCFACGHKLDIGKKKPITFQFAFGYNEASDTLVTFKKVN